MLAEISLEALRYLDRTALEGLQIQDLRDLVNRHVRTFPLRHIQEVEVAMLKDGLHVYIRSVEEQGGVTLAASEQKLEMLFHRVNNAFIRGLDLSFCPTSIPLLQYLRANANHLRCQVGALHINVRDRL